MQAVWVVRRQRGWAAVPLVPPEPLETRARWAAPATRARQAQRVVRRALAERRRGAAGAAALAVLGRARPRIARTVAATAPSAFANAPLRSAAPPGQPARPAAGVRPATRWGSAGSTPCRSGR